MMMILRITSSSSLFEILKIFGRFAADFRGATYDLAECFDKTLIFGLDTTINRQSLTRRFQNTTPIHHKAITNKDTADQVNVITTIIIQHNVMLQDYTLLLV